ncbi:hypothetical protein [Burkholderia sp. HI2500]|nr:hypothetical protein [Burkholderia sp. HI2500]
MQASVLSPPFLDYRYRVIDVVGRAAEIPRRPGWPDARRSTLDDAN